MDFRMALYYIVAWALTVFGGLWLCVLAYQDKKDSTVWLLLIFPLYEILWGLLHLKKALYPLLIILAACAMWVIDYVYFWV